MNKGMKMSKHTPGPWLSNTDDRYVREERSGATIALVCDDDGHCDAEHRHAMPIGANASLIAAAPDLLAACERALANIETNGGGADLADQLRAAIAKAEARP